jgi:uncharacterized protein YdaU (DUF1376 family)
MTPDEKYMKAIADTNKRLNAVEQKLDAFFSALHEKNAADIAYIAMMSDVDIEDEEVEPNE